MIQSLKLLVFDTFNIMCKWIPALKSKIEVVKNNAEVTK